MVFDEQGAADEPVWCRTSRSVGRSAGVSAGVRYYETQRRANKVMAHPDSFTGTEDSITNFKFDSLCPDNNTLLLYRSLLSFFKSS